MKHLLGLTAVVLLAMSYSHSASAQAGYIDGSRCHVFNDFARNVTVTRCDLGRIEPGIGYNWAVPMMTIAPYTYGVYCSLYVSDMWGNSRLLVPSGYRIPSDVNFTGNGRNYNGVALFYSWPAEAYAGGSSRFECSEPGLRPGSFTGFRVDGVYTLRL